MPKSRFEYALLELFLQAEAEGRRGPAEHLMRALEALYAGPDTGVDPPTSGDDEGAAIPRRFPEAVEQPPQRDGGAGRGGRQNE